MKIKILKESLEEPKGLGNKLGSGVQGIVYRLENGQVAKLTKKKQEAEIATLILNKKIFHEALPIFTSVNKTTENKWWLVREDLRDFPKNKELDRVLGDFEVMTVYTDWSPAVQQAQNSLNSLEGKNLEYAKKMFSLYEYAKQIGMKLTDSRTSNWGLRGDQPVLRDFGAARINV